MDVEAGLPEFRLAWTERHESQSMELDGMLGQMSHPRSFV